ncbi:MAG: hypothetical protein H6797_05790 [Candidatus Nomurabacteria bacterium]|nr:MAG: hypothetical protein H6797_05790 [Candidatus Nomurabacteria bacterium]
MSKHEVPTPTVHELKELFSNGESDISIADGLVYVALGLYEDKDYLGLVRTAMDMHAIKDVAIAEARLQHIANHDKRESYDNEYLADCNDAHDRLAGLGMIMEDLSQDVKDTYFKEIEAETRILEGEQFAADNGLTDL